MKTKKKIFVNFRILSKWKKEQKIKKFIQKELHIAWLMKYFSNIAYGFLSICLSCFPKNSAETN